MKHVSIAITALALSGCETTKYVPELVTLPQAKKPKECLIREHRNLHNLPEMRADETIEEFMKRIGAVQRMNVTRYRYIRRNKSICRKYVKRV